VNDQKIRPIDPEVFDRTAPAWNCVAYPGEGMHLTARDGSCRWCGMTKAEIAREQK
jgi:hypothetical protein